MTKFLKENWFVLVIAALFLAGTIWFTYDQHKDDLPGKSKGGKDVVFSVDDTDVTADELYDKLYPLYGKETLFMEFYKAVLDSAVETTPEFQSKADSTLAQTISYYYNYGYTQETLDEIAQYYYGYPDFASYVFYQLKAEDMNLAYIKEHINDFYNDEFAKKYNPRVVSYCLIKMENPASPSAEDSERLASAQKAWASEQYNVDNFAEFAKQYSEDPASAPDGGKFGYLDINTGVVPAFLEAALSLEEGQVSDWIFDENYGYFLIKCDSKKVDDFVNDSTFMSTVLSENENLSNDIVWEYAQDANVKFTDETVKEFILKELGVNKESEEN